MTDASNTAPPRRQRSLLRRILRRGPWEAVMMTLIGLGVFMLMQPFSLWLFGWSLTPLLVGTFGFIIVSHFPD